MEVKVSFLIVNIIMLLLQITVIISNGFILLLFVREKSLRQNSSRKLVLFLAANDFIHAFTTLPYTTYLMCSWNPIHLDLSPYYVMISSIPVIFQLKINLVLTISIAFERILALYFPVIFRKLSSHSYATICLLFGSALAVFDLILEFSFTPFNSVPNCAALGCFLSDKFRHYWGISNMAMGMTVIVLTSLILFKLRSIQKQPNSVGVAVMSRENRIKQANRTCTGILLVSSVFVTLPSVGVGLVEMVGFSIFNAIGPFYIVGVLCAGACNSVVHIALNNNMRERGLALLRAVHTATTT